MNLPLSKKPLEKAGQSDIGQALQTAARSTRNGARRPARQRGDRQRWPRKELEAPGMGREARADRCRWSRGHDSGERRGVGREARARGRLKKPCGFRESSRTMSPADRRRNGNLSNGMVIVASVRARLLGLQLLKVDADVTVSPTPPRLRDRQSGAGHSTANLGGSAAVSTKRIDRQRPRCRGSVARADNEAARIGTPVDALRT